jgi:hypothetical protein
VHKVEEQGFEHCEIQETASSLRYQQIVCVIRREYRDYRPLIIDVMGPGIGQIDSNSWTTANQRAVFCDPVPTNIWVIKGVTREFFTYLVQACHLFQWRQIRQIDPGSLVAGLKSPKHHTGLDRKFAAREISIERT